MNIHDLIKRFNLYPVLIATLTFVIGWQLGHRDVQLQWDNFRPTVNVQNQTPPENVNVDFKLFWDTWNLVSQEYFDKEALDHNKMFYGAIQGMVAAIDDPYTVFLPPEQQKSTKEELGGSFEGVGIQLGFNKDKRLVVIAPLDGTPAKKAGVLPEDLIVKINDSETTNISLPEAVKMIRGPKGTEVALTVYRSGDTDTKEFKLQRDTIVVKSVEISFKQNKQGEKIGVIKLSRFGDRTQEEWNQAVSDALSQGIKGVVLDLRNNPGGYLDGAIFIASEFLDNGTVVIQENNHGKKTPFGVNRKGKLINLPTTVLVNKGSASASEIVAGALQDHNRAKLVGTKSFGKGTIQQSEELPGNTGLHVTIARWLTPNARWVNELEGLDPDITVEIPKPKEGETVDDTKDIQLDKALELLALPS